MLKKSLYIANLNIQNRKSAWLTGIILCGMMMLQTIVNMILLSNGIDNMPSDGSQVSGGMFLFLVPVIAAFFHTLASLHEWWVGWAVDALLARRKIKIKKPAVCTAGFFIIPVSRRTVFQSRTRSLYPPRI